MYLLVLAHFEKIYVMPTKVGIHYTIKNTILDSRRVESSTRFRGNDKLSQYVSILKFGTDCNRFMRLAKNEPKPKLMDNILGEGENNKGGR